jgi:Undecaprenyl-phosphate glucose phosphotransferase
VLHTIPEDQVEEPIGFERRGPMRPKRLSPTRQRIRGDLISDLFRLFDFLALAAMAAFVSGLLEESGWVSPLSIASTTFATASVSVAYLVLAGGYDLSPREGLIRHGVRIAAAMAATGLTLFAGLELMGASPGLVVIWTYQLATCFAAIVATHLVWLATVRRWRSRGLLAPIIVIVGANHKAQLLIESALQSGQVAVIGVFDDRLNRAPKSILGVPNLGDVDSLVGHRVIPFVDQIVIAVTPFAENRVRSLVEKLSVLPNNIMLFMDSDAPETAATTIDKLSGWPLARLSGRGMSSGQLVAKRAQDIVLGSIALITVGPLMLLIALAVKLDSPGPVFFRQRRHGFNNEEIIVWKFRSMRHDRADAGAVRQVKANDDRVTRVGRFIRRTSLDELPQIFNVLTGEMSLVGPRPHAVDMHTGDVRSDRLIAVYAHRHRIKPGMTGWAAINGSRGPVDSREAVVRRIELDISYIERQSFWLDLYIMAMTLPCLLGDRQATR